MALLYPVKTGCSVFVVTHNMIGKEQGLKLETTVCGQSGHCGEREKKMREREERELESGNEF